MRLLICIAAVFVFAACTKEGEGPARASNDRFDVQRLFTADGCTVYRFFDAGNFHYFVNCPGGGVSTRQSYQCGKARCYRPEIIRTSLPE